MEGEDAERQQARGQGDGGKRHEALDLTVALAVATDAADAATDGGGGACGVGGGVLSECGLVPPGATGGGAVSVPPHPGAGHMGYGSALLPPSLLPSTHLERLRRTSMKLSTILGRGGGGGGASGVVTHLLFGGQVWGGQGGRPSWPQRQHRHLRRDHQQVPAQRDFRDCHLVYRDGPPPNSTYSSKQLVHGQGGPYLDGARLAGKRGGM